MGVDIYGKRFGAEYEADSKLFDEGGVEEYLNIPVEKRPWRQDLPGRYYQTSWWGWRALAEFICETFPEIASHCRYWQSNDGDGLNAALSVRLADGLDAMIADGSLADLIEMRRAKVRNLPMRECFICHGSGIRADEIGTDDGDPFKMIPEDARDARDEGPHPRAGQTGWCNGCDGRGHRLPREADYPLEFDEVKQFAEFCRHSGGFEIH